MKDLRKAIALIAALFVLGAANNAKAADITVTGDICTQTWTPDNEYFLDGFVFVTPGCVLTIEAGTVVRGIASPSNADNASALIISRGAQIICIGAADNPIIFTSESDDLSDAFDIDQFTTGLWGGLILLGNAPLNSPASGFNGSFIEDFIEGIPEARSEFGAFGGINAADNSGVLKYVSIRHAGAELIPNEEINGLTLGGVGSATSIDCVEVYANDDDGIEWFGGTCPIKRSIVAFVSDDSYDYDQGSTFNAQFVFSIGDNAAGSNRAGEHDGATSPESATPFTIPNFSNATYIGKGIAPTGEPEIILFRDNAGGRYQNSVFCESNSGLRVELNFNEVLTSNTQLNAGNLSIRNCAFGGGTLFVPAVAFNIVGSNCDPTDPNCNSQLNIARNVAANIFNASNNSLVTTGCPINGLARLDASAGLDPRTSGTFATNFSGAFSNPFFEQVGYIGAFGPTAGDFWATGWSYLAERQIFVPDFQ